MIENLFLLTVPTIEQATDLARKIPQVKLYMVEHQRKIEIESLKNLETNK